jgi:hypothetical protein
MEIKEQIEKDIILVAIDRTPQTIDGLRLVDGLVEKLDGKLPITLTEKEIEIVKYCVFTFNGWSTNDKEARKQILAFADRLK